MKDDAEGVEPPEPGAKQRGSLHGLREDAPARTHERRLPEVVGPIPERCRRKRLDGRGEMPRGRTIALEEAVQTIGMGEIEAAAPGEEEFAREGGHAIVDRDGAARESRYLGGHQAGRAAADDDDVGGSRHGRALLVVATRAAGLKHLRVRWIRLT